MGRPSEFTPEIANEICDLLIEGKSLRAICALEGMPNASTVCRWLANNEEFRKQYAHARDAQADTIADETLAIADDAALDPQDRRVRIDTRKWLAAKLKPKAYGEKVALTGGGENDAPIKTELAVKFV